jgi:hypothetical protein
VEEYELKTAYIYNFALFTSWPQDWPPETGGTMAICTIGLDQFGSALDQLQGRKIRGKRLIVRRSVTLQEAPTCHMLYIALSEQENMTKINEAISSSSVLTISDVPVEPQKKNSEKPPTKTLSEHDQLMQKSIVTLAIDNKRLIFEVDSMAAKLARLSMSSKLLHLARHVN